MNAPVMDVSVVSVRILKRYDGMCLREHVYKHRSRLFVSYAYVPNKLLNQPYCWEHPKRQLHSND